VSRSLNFRSFFSLLSWLLLASRFIFSLTFRVVSCILYTQQRKAITRTASGSSFYIRTSLSISLLPNGIALKASTRKLVACFTYRHEFLDFPTLKFLVSFVTLSSYRWLRRQGRLSIKGEVRFRSKNRKSVSRPKIFALTEESIKNAKNFDINA